MKVRDVFAPIDPLGDALGFLRMSGVFCCRSELTASWGLALPAIDETMSFHVVTAGGGWLELDGEPPLRLEAGDLALVPHDRGHRLVSEPGVRAYRIDELPHEEVRERYAYLVHGTGGAPTSLVCGSVRFEHESARVLVELLPRVIHVRASSAPEHEWMRSTIALLASEAKAMRPGGETILARLADLLVVHAIRDWMERAPREHEGWIAGLRDPQIGRALALVHRDPSRPWTLETLARAVGMSRSAFAARFTELLGEPAMTYVARWRMQIAHGMLARERAGLGEVAGKLGYSSEAAFSRAFKRYVGVSPGSLKRS
ncbi:AraC family transcriptional regulator [Sandaracinus amylolyticus]|uniref:AraC family transcriptional regulator n=1 Tax=Sandaracinus amylolyticus TaxID=927083 RepID=UPI001F1A64C5|nr:AraC family transcriptional regulator [Sandaracinus amylolyticus]UJR85649.1 Hypothetical protein I5071_77290 [Sandaracinus amylolyticus]